MNKLLTTFGGILFIFGISGIIYGLLPYPYLIGSISIIVSVILTLIIESLKKRKRKKR